MTAPERHAPNYIRPSAFNALSLCPARAQMEALCWNRFGRHLVDDDGEEESSEVASMGTACHDIVAHCIDQWCAWGVDPQSCVDDAAAQFRGLSTWDVGCIRACIRYLMMLVERVGAEPDHVLTEQHLPGEAVGIRRGGTADVLIVIPFKQVVVIDWKYGFLQQQDAPDNDQLAAYAVMASDAYTADTVEVHIYQPRLDPDDRASAARFEWADLRETADWMKQVAADALSPAAELNPGMSQCFYCRAAHHCPALREHIVNAIEAADAMPEEATPEYMGALFATSKTASKWGDDCKKMLKAYREKMGPGSIAGAKLRGSGSMSVIEDVRALWDLASRQGIEDLVLDAAKISANKLMTAAGDHAELLQQFVTKNPKAPALVAGKEEA